MELNKVQPAGFSSAAQKGIEERDRQIGAKMDERLECDDEPLFSNSQVMNKLMGIIDQLGDLNSIKLEDSLPASNAEEAGAAQNGIVSNTINKAIQKMIVDINEKGFIIKPNGTFKRVWDTIMALALLWSITVSPIRISILFEEDLIAIDLGDMIVDLFFLTDFILKFFTGFYQYGRLIKKKRKIAKRYFKNKFVFMIDMVTSIPINFLVPNGPNSSLNFQPINIFQDNKRLLRYIRATKMIRYLRIFKEIEGFVDILTFKRIKSVVMKKMCETFIVTVSYFIISACLWYICGVHNVKDRDNWIFRLGYIGKDYWTILLASLYWTIQTIFTVGYGDMPALTKLEMVFSIFTQIFGSIILSYIYASMAIFIKYLNQEKESKRYTIDYLKKVRRKYNLPRMFITELIKKIKAETENLIEDLDLICDGLEPELVRVLKLSVFKKKYEKVHQITSKNDDFIFYFGSHFKQISYTDGEMIIKENDPPTKSKRNFNQVFFIESGNVLLYESKETKDSDVKIGNEESFGEIEYHQPQNKRVLLAKASGPVTCYTLSYEIYAKYCQNMIEKEVEELKETAIDRHTNIMNNLKKLHNERRMLERRNDKRISGDERRSDFRSDN